MQDSLSVCFRIYCENERENNNKCNLSHKWHTENQRCREREKCNAEGTKLKSSKK